MPYFMLKTSNLADPIQDEYAYSEKLKSYSTILSDVLKNIGISSKYSSAYKSRIKGIVNQINEHVNKMDSVASTLEAVRIEYIKAEKSIIEKVGGQSTVSKPIDQKDKTVSDIVKKVISKAGTVGAVVGTVMTIAGREEFKLVDLAKDVKAIWSTGFKVFDTIGKGISPQKRTECDWAKELLGLGKGSSLQKILRSSLSKGEKVKNAAASSWKHSLRELGTTKGKGALILSGVANSFSNADEYMTKYNNGEVSYEYAVGRAVTESVVETAVDWGKDVLIMTGVTAVAAALNIAAPAILVGGAAVVVSSGLDLFCKWATKKCLNEEKGVTEFVSDIAIDFAEGAVKTIGKGVKNIKNGAKAAWKGITKIFK